MPVQPAPTLANGRKTAVWLSFDLGLRGDYANLYAWLDDHKARECGDATAYFEISGVENTEEWLRTEINQHVKLAARDRIYAIYKEGDLIKGEFISGGRKRAPWEGYGQADVAANTADLAY